MKQQNSNLKCSKRAKLPALEKNILKYRALQMVLLLYKVEEFRAFLIGSIRASDKMPPQVYAQPLLPVNAKKPMKKAFQILVDKQILTQAESDDLQNIVDIRNQIGHAVHELVSDISAPRTLRDYIECSSYDYDALARFEQYEKKISKGMTEHFILKISFKDLIFEQAEATYKEELRRLHQRIERQFKERERYLANIQTAALA